MPQVSVPQRFPSSLFGFYVCCNLSLRSITYVLIHIYVLYVCISMRVRVRVHVCVCGSCLFVMKIQKQKRQKKRNEMKNDNCKLYSIKNIVAIPKCF